MNERWKWVNGYVGRYLISDRGRLVSILRYSNGNKKFIFRKITVWRNGYHGVGLDSGRKNVYNTGIHRLVAIAFIKNPKEKPCVNHKDGNKNNNHYTNLEWVTRSENTLHMYRVLKVPPNRNGMRKIRQLDLEGNFIKEWDSAASAKRFIRPNGKGNTIFDCLYGLQHKSYGYKWEYAS